MLRMRCRAIADASAQYLGNRRVAVPPASRNQQAPSAIMPARQARCHRLLPNEYRRGCAASFIRRRGHIPAEYAYTRRQPCSAAGFACQRVAIACHHSLRHDRRLAHSKNNDGYCHVSNNQRNNKRNIRASVADGTNAHRALNLTRKHTNPWLRRAADWPSGGIAVISSCTRLTPGGLAAREARAATSLFMLDC